MNISMIIMFNLRSKGRGADGRIAKFFFGNITAFSVNHQNIKNEYPSWCKSQLIGFEASSWILI